MKLATEADNNLSDENASPETAGSIEETTPTPSTPVSTGEPTTKDANPPDEIVSPDNFEYAGFWRRLVALSTDNFIFSIFTPLFMGLVVVIAGGLNQAPPPEAFISIAVAILACLYHAAFIKLFGATPGKRLLKCRVVHHQSGALLSWKNSFIRYFVSIAFTFIIAGPVTYYAVTSPESFAAENVATSANELPEKSTGVLVADPDETTPVEEDFPDYVVYSAGFGIIIFLVGYLMSLFNVQRRTLHDYAAGSVVVIYRPT